MISVRGPPIISNNSTMSIVSNVLKITPVHKEDRGTYYCIADNGVSRGDIRNINLEVEEKIENLLVGKTFCLDLSQFTQKLNAEEMKLKNY